MSGGSQPNVGSRRKANVKPRVVAPWQHTERDRGWTARVERAIERGEYTPPEPK